MADAKSGILNYYINNYLNRDYSTGRTASVSRSRETSSAGKAGRTGSESGSFATVLARSLDEATRADRNSLLLSELAGGTNSASLISALSSGSYNNMVLSELLGTGRNSSLIGGSGSSALSSLLSGGGMNQASLMSTISRTSSGSAVSAPSSLENLFEAASSKYDVPINLLKAVAKAESGFRTDAVSSAGAQGIMQLMPATARALGVTDSFDPEQNVMGGAKYLAQMLDRYDGNIDLTLAAYNAGSGAVAKYGGVPPYAETRNYIARVKSYMGEGVKVPDVSVSGTGKGIDGTSENELDKLDPAALKRLSEALNMELQMNIMKMEMNMLNFDDEDRNSRFSYLSSII